MLCGNTVKWVERKFPGLSGWEPCPLHVAARRMFEALVLIAQDTHERDSAGQVARSEIATARKLGVSIMPEKEVDHG